MFSVFTALALFLASAAVIQLCLADGAQAYERKPQKPAIVLAAFGTTEVEALPAILNVQKELPRLFRTMTCTWPLRPI